MSRVHVGLPYISDVETLDLESAQGTIQGLNKSVTEVTFKFFKSRGLFVGNNANNLTEWKQREFEKLGEPTQLRTGEETIGIEPDWTGNGRIFIRQKDPLPMTILAIVPDVFFEDDEQ